ncbi:MAG: hypothetical protein AB7F89_25160 [Pirellulaceae bacterium]
MSSESATSTTTQVLDVHQLRRLWKPHKQRLLDAQPGHPAHVRFHRACSWLQSVEKMVDDVNYDHALISQWIAFNALYGQWDARAHEPVADRECWRVFVDRIVDLDKEQIVVAMLRTNRGLVLSLLDDEYLSGYFWKDPCKEQAGRARKTKFKGQSWFVEGSWKLMLEQLLERVYLMRCQLVHGAATHGSQLNRRSLKHCSVMMGHLLPAMLQVWISHGADEDWGVMCYPPITARPGKPK